MYKILTFVLVLVSIEKYVLSDEIRKFALKFPSSSAMVGAAIKVIEDNQQNRVLRFVISPNTSHDLINDIALETIYRFEQIKIFKRFSSITRHRYFNIFFVENYDSFRVIYDDLTRDVFNYQELFLIIILKKYDDLLLDIAKIFNDMWMKSVINVNILVESDKNSQANIYTYFPYSKLSCGEAHSVLWNTFKNGKFKSQTPSFPSKVKNLYRCPLKIASFNSPPFLEIRMQPDGKYHFGGLEGELLKMLAERMNFDINLTLMAENSLRWGNLYSNGTSTGALKMVHFMYNFFAIILQIVLGNG